jgi:uncharacterized protein (TIGR02611 family)
MTTKPDEQGSQVGVLDRIRANQTGRPGWAIVILGLAIWAIEFVWAKHLLEFTKRHVLSWTHWVGRQSLPMRALIGVLGMIFVGAIVWASVKMSFGVDLVSVVWNWLFG